MITVLKQIKGHNKVESLQIMLEVLEKNFSHDERIECLDWCTLFAWLEQYYVELKEMFIKERGF